MSAKPLPRDEVAAAIATSAELGSDYDGAVADALAERLEHAIDERVAERVASQSPARSPRRQGVPMKIAGMRFALAVVSLILAVPLTAVAAGSAEQSGAAVFAVWLGIAAVNAFFVLATRRTS